MLTFAISLGFITVLVVVGSLIPCSHPYVVSMASETHYYLVCVQCKTVTTKTSIE
jgi:hypothetical protein